MTESSAGDNLDLKVNRKSSEQSSLKIEGWFDLLHTSAETGEITDYSGPNSILNAGLLALSTGLLGVAGTSAGTTTGVWISGVGSAAGEVFVAGASENVDTDAMNITTYHQTATPVGSGNFEASNGVTEIGSGTSSFNVNVFYKNGPATIWTASSGTTSPVTTSHAAMQITNANSTQRTINSIFIAGCAGAAGATVRLLAGRGVQSLNNSQLNNGNGIVMSENDTLDITYTISLTATA